MTGAGGIGTAAAGVLAIVFAWAGVAKLASPAATAAALERLGLPSPRALAVTIPAVELGLGGLLLARPRPGGAVALGLLGAFSGFLAVRLAGGRQVGCGCFGSHTTGSLSAHDLVRNALLAVLAGAALAAPGWTRPDLAAVIAVSTALAAGVVLLALARLRATTTRLWATAPLLERGGER